MVCGDLWASTGEGTSFVLARQRDLGFGCQLVKSPAAVTTARLRDPTNGEAAADWRGGVRPLFLVTWCWFVFLPLRGLLAPVVCGFCLFLGMLFPPIQLGLDLRSSERLRMSPDLQTARACPSQLEASDKLVAFSVCSFPSKRKG